MLRIFDAYSCIEISTVYNKIHFKMVLMCKYPYLPVFCTSYILYFFTQLQ